MQRVEISNWIYTIPLLRRVNNMSEINYDEFFTQESLNIMSSSLKKYYSDFDIDKFLYLIFKTDIKSLLIMKKMRHVTFCLHKVMPSSFNKTVEIFIKSAQELGFWEAMSYADYVSVYGQKHWDISMLTLTELTKHTSSEFAIRPFLINETTKTTEYLLSLTEHKNDNVRRYATEGCRPTHPWGIDLPRFKKDPMLILPILEKLKNDESEFVRRSVANNLNTISKNHPNLIIDVTRNWKGKNSKTDDLLKHACRTLLKKGNREVMEIFGYYNSNNIQIIDFSLGADQIKLGERMPFSFNLNITGDEELLVRIEYAIYFIKKNGTSGRKVLKVAEKVFKPGLYPYKRKGYKFIDRTTRTLYNGQHSIAIIVNGVEKELQTFELIK